MKCLEHEVGWLQLQGNPLEVEQAELFTKLAKGLPVLRQIDEKAVPPSKVFTHASLAAVVRLCRLRNVSGVPLQGQCGVSNRGKASLLLL